MMFKITSVALIRACEHPEAMMTVGGNRCLGAFIVASFAYKYYGEGRYRGVSDHKVLCWTTRPASLVSLLT